MKLDKATNTLALRLYDWSVRDFIRELESDCPLMSAVGLNNRRVAGFVAWNKTLSRTERRGLAQALVRQAHGYAAVRLKGETVTDEDRCWDQEYYKNTTLHMHDLPPLPTADQNAPTFQQVNPDDCLDTLVKELSPVLGNATRRRSTVLCRRTIGDWKISTQFKFHRGETDLRFEYQFCRKDGPPVPRGDYRPFPDTLFLFYGVYTTNVIVPSEADSEPMAKAIAKLAEYFVSQADPLFADLMIEDQLLTKH
jgi:hypothetical protein